VCFVIWFWNRYCCSRIQDEYKKAKELFPVDHWQKIAQDSIDRLMKNKIVKQFYATDDFEQYLNLVIKSV
jgi:hypothetical protein